MWRCLRAEKFAEWPYGASYIDRYQYAIYIDRHQYVIWFYIDVCQCLRKVA